MFNEELFKKMIADAVSEAMAKFIQVPTVAATEKKYIYSIKGLAEFLQCSVVTAQSLKNKGLIPCKQLGRKVIFEESEILAAMHGNKLSKKATR